MKTLTINLEEDAYKSIRGEAAMKSAMGNLYGPVDTLVAIIITAIDQGHESIKLDLETLIDLEKKLR